LAVRATDDEGAEGVSEEVRIVVANQAPEILAVGLSAVGQSYADQDVEVLRVDCSDPEGDPVSLGYQWQSSADGKTYQDAPGESGPRLAAASSRRGRLWRCRVIAADGEGESDPFFSDPVVLLDRPGLGAEPGGFYSYSSGLVMSLAPPPVTAHALLNEFSLGPAGGVSQWVEILTLKETDLASWDLSDNSERLVFENSGVWERIPPGTLVVVYNGTAPKNEALPPDDFDPADGQMVVPSTRSGYFSPIHDLWITLGEQGDSLSLNDPESVAVHALCYGNNHSTPLHIDSLGPGMGGLFGGGSEAEATDPQKWHVSPTDGNPTPGRPNNAANAAWIDALRGAPAKFRLGTGTTLPPGLSLDPDSGLLSGTIDPGAPPGAYPVVIERADGAGRVASQSFILGVGVPSGFHGWIAGFGGLPDKSPDGDPDSDGATNLLEYALGTRPDEPNPPFRFSLDPDGFSLVFQRSKIHADVELAPEWTANLDDGAHWTRQGILLRQIGEDAETRTFRATLPVDAAHPRRFLRLRAFLVPGR
jgi:hypothetical protein